MSAVRSRISSKLILASCVGYFDRAYYIYMIIDCGVRRELVALSRMKSQQGHGVRWMSTGRKKTHGPTHAHVQIPREKNQDASGPRTTEQHHHQLTAVTQLDCVEVVQLLLAVLIFTI